MADARPRPARVAVQSQIAIEAHSAPRVVGLPRVRREHHHDGAGLAVAHDERGVARAGAAVQVEAHEVEAARPALADTKGERRAPAGHEQLRPSQSVVEDPRRRLRAVGIDAAGRHEPAALAPVPPEPVDAVAERLSARIDEEPDRLSPQVARGAGVAGDAVLRRMRCVPACRAGAGVLGRRRGNRGQRRCTCEPGRAGDGDGSRTICAHLNQLLHSHGLPQRRDPAMPRFVAESRTKDSPTS